MRIAAFSDLHLGGGGSPGLGWARKAVDRAARKHADVLIFAGDLIAHRRANKKVIGWCERLLDHAAQVEVPMLLVWGNHDVSVGLPELDIVPPSITVAPSDEVLDMKIGGYTIHALSVASNPDPRRVVKLFPKAKEPRHVGVLHTSVTGEHSNAACLPTTVKQLESRHYAAWVLGHVHEPVQLTETIGWPGMKVLQLIDLPD
ncbi:MAG: metallophosphoesterase [Microbacterium sp.]